MIEEGNIQTLLESVGKEEVREEEGRKYPSHNQNSSTAAQPIDDLASDDDVEDYHHPQEVEVDKLSSHSE